MSFEGIDEWDENFLDEAIRIELHALSTRSTPNPNPNPISTLPLQFPPIPPLSADQSRVSSGTIENFSPPRELSQRVVVDSGVDCEIVLPPIVGRNGRHGAIKKDKEVDRLKRELTRVTKQLNHLEHECVELRNDRAKKDEQLRGALSQIEAKDAEIQSLKRYDDKLDVQNRTFSDKGGHNQHDQNVRSRHLPQGLQDASNLCSSKPRSTNEPSSLFCRDPALFQYSKGDNMQTDSSGVITELNGRVLAHSNLTTSTGSIVKDNTLPAKSSRSKSTMTIGTQTEFCQDCLHVSPMNLADEQIAKKLLSVWGFPYNKGTGKNMVSKLLASCSEDFCELFRCMHAPSNMKGLKVEDTTFSATAMPSEMQSTLSTVSSKVALLYSKFIKMQNRTTNLQDFVEGLLEICTLENDFVVQKSLHILHVIVQHIMSCNTRSSRRNVSVYQPGGNVHEERNLSTRDLMTDVQNPSETSGTLKDVKSFDLEKMWKGEERICEDDNCLSSETMVLIFGTMRQISVSSKDEIIRFEAMSIIILILMGNEPNTAKDRFDMIPLLESTVLLLKKEAGLRVNKQAVRLLFLILNSPKVMMIFCGKCRDGTVKTEVDDDPIDVLQTTRSSILEGLSESLSLGGTGTMELKLRKQVIILLAYIAASGKSGFEVLLNPVGHNGPNILQLVMRLLASEVDAEITEFTKSQTICKERTSLLREGLIMLNRLASHSVYSRITLDCLTSSSSVAISTMDVANKIPHKSRGCWKHDALKRTPMEAELVDLAELFRARVLAFLAERHDT